MLVLFDQINFMKYPLLHQFDQEFFARNQIINLAVLVKAWLTNVNSLSQN